MRVEVAIPMDFSENCLKCEVRNNMITVFLGKLYIGTVLLSVRITTTADLIKTFSCEHGTLLSSLMGHTQVSAAQLITMIASTG